MITDAQKLQLAELLSPRYERHRFVSAEQELQRAAALRLPWQRSKRGS